MTVFFVISTIGGLLAWGFHPLVNISGVRISALHALVLDLPALAIYCLPVLSIACFGVFLSVATRQSVAAVGGTVIYAMALQGVAVIHAISGVDPYLLTNQMTAWHALFESPFHIGPILRAIWVSVAFALPPLIAALVIFNRRDVAD
jgi:ABC-2 type transport system permease protein